jgi:hypothetical protein
MKEVYNKWVAVLVLGMLVVGVQGVVAQPQSFSVGLIINNNGSDRDTLLFGSHANATYCIDAGIGEYEAPPPPPTEVFDVRFIDPRGQSECMGQGEPINYHYWDTAAVTDTFQVKIQAGAGGYPVTLSWPSGLDTFYSSLRLRDLFGGFLYDVDMLTTTTLSVTNAAIDKLNIIGVVKPRIPLFARDNNLLPENFALAQNYPNPFNPTTSIKFEIVKTSVATISVYDILGRKVTTLVSEQLTPGFYTVTWNGTDERGFSVGTGIYYVRMTAHPENGEQDYSAVKKIMLMK